MYPFSLKLPILIQPKLQLATQVFLVAMCTAFAGLGAIAGFFFGAVFALALAGLFKVLLGCPSSHAPKGPEEALEEISCKLIWKQFHFQPCFGCCPQPLPRKSLAVISPLQEPSQAAWLGWEGPFSVEPSAG